MEATAQTNPTGGASVPASYADAVIPEPYRILGLRLRPFSLGHYLLLQKFRCAYIHDDPKPGHDDLTIGVLVCSMRFAEFLEFIETKSFLRQVRKWGRQQGLYNFAEKSALFAQYLKTSLTEPDYISTRGEEGDGGDWTQNLKTTLVTKLGYSDQEALDMPLSKAFAEYFKLAESEGILRLLTPEDLAAADANAAALAEWQAKQSTLNPSPNDGP